MMTKGHTDPFPPLSLIAYIFSELSLRSQNRGSAYHYFNEILSVCHTVVVETDQETGAKDYQVGKASHALALYMFAIYT